MKKHLSKRGVLNLSLAVVLLTLTVVLAANQTSFDSLSRSHPEGSFWDLDLFHLEPHVPFPGPQWLDRISSENSLFEYNGKMFSSVYAAMLDDRPLDYPCRNLNAWINSIFLPAPFAGALVHRLGLVQHLDFAHYLLCYVRNFMGAMLVYYGTAGIFHYFCYISPMSKDIFEGQARQRPGAAIMWDQIQLAQMSMILYILLPVLDEWLIETGKTPLVYFTVHEIGGWFRYAASMLFYFACVEMGIYWMHRTLHTNKTLYKYIHMLHHKYNKPETLTPWASIAFHPLDGILQACPYVLCLWIAPCHYPTHFALLFFTAIWATYIHDAMDWNVWEIMGSKYHTYHHTHYIYNYGQVFTFCDRFWGTFKEPPLPTGAHTLKKN